MARKHRGKSKQERHGSEGQGVDTGPVELRQHGDYEEEVAQSGRRLRRKSPHPLSLYFNTGKITQRQREAGEKWEQDYQASGSMRSTSGSMEPRVDGGNGLSETEEQAFKRRRWSAGWNAIAGVHDRQLTFDVCIQGKYLSALAEEEAFPYFTSAIQLLPNLKRALDDLAKYYHIPHYPPPEEKNSRPGR